MADLVTLAEMKTYLGDTPATSDDALLTALLNDVEALFESATLREAGYYTAGGTERVEVRDGTGTARLYLDYPIAEDGLISVSLGYDSSAPVETLSTTDRRILVYGAGSRCITRVDGGVFGQLRQARYIEVVYEHTGNLPDGAKLAIKSVVASIYRERGSEGMKSETVGDFYSYTRDDIIAMTATDPVWQSAVVANTPVVLA